MFPLTHVFFVSEVLKIDHPLALLGSVVPDLGGVLGVGRTCTHEMGLPFLAYCEENNPSHNPLAYGIISHGSKPEGLDYFSDEAYGGQTPGYCFQKSVDLVEEVVKACHLPPAMGQWKAHNFIEMGFELYIAENFPSVSERISHIIQNEVFVVDTADILGTYLQVDKTKTRIMIKCLPSYFCLKDVTIDNLAFNYALNLEKMHQIKTENYEQMGQIIQKAYQIVYQDVEKFFADVEKAFKNNINNPEHPLVLNKVSAKG